MFDIFIKPIEALSPREIYYLYYLYIIRPPPPHTHTDMIILLPFKGFLWFLKSRGRGPRLTSGICMCCHTATQMTSVSAGHIMIILTSTQTVGRGRGPRDQIHKPHDQAPPPPPPPQHPLFKGNNFQTAFRKWGAR